tara:strand:+ start:1056 stop:1325 length:270 start_codon:yes stop_codon:yes gene_type:complete
MSEETANIERSSHSEAMKIWQKAGTFNEYSDAADKARELIAEWDDKDLEIRIRRVGPGGEQFRVKYWHPDLIKSSKKAKKTKKRKKNVE